VRSTCKTPAEINSWLSNKFIYIVYNTQLFQPEQFGADTFQKVSVINRVSINLNDQSVTPYNYIPTRLEAKDSVWPGKPDMIEYYNMLQGQSYSFYQIPSMVAGVSL
jgi:hypothetical protein